MPSEAANTLKIDSRSGSQLRRLVLALFLLNVASASLFIRLINRPVYDDQFNITDVHRYATGGVTVASVRANKNPPGPTSFAWMAAMERVIGGDELRDARIGALLSWILLGAGILIGARYTQSPEPWYAAFLAMLVFPHSVESAALVLTEGPALLFAMLGAMLWVEFVSRPMLARRDLPLGIVGGLSLGLAVTCRQYYLALLPAALLLALWEGCGGRWKKNRRWYASVLLSLAAAALPVLPLVFIWRGLSSPGMATGASYKIWTSRVGLAVDRPLIAAFYVAIYFLFLVTPDAFQLKFALRWRVVAALCGGVLAGVFCKSVLQPGPLSAAIQFVARGALARSAAVGAIATVAVYVTAGALALLWEKRHALLSQPAIVFAVATVAFFIAEQIGVGGNIPFYDRYLLQVAPFLGIIAFALFPRITRGRLTVLAALFLTSQVMLWRFAFGG